MIDDTPPFASHNCFTCQARGRSEWCVLGEEDLALIDRAKQPRRYAPGQSIFEQGEPCTGIYCIDSGTVARRKMDADGNSVLVQLAHAGQTLGYRDYFAGGAYTVSADVLEPTVACHIESAVLRRVLSHSPALGLQFLRHLAQDVEQADQTRLAQDTLPVRTRLAHLLLTLKDRYGGLSQRGGIALSLPLNRQDMAALLGTRPETVTRNLRALADDNVLQVSGRNVVIPSLDTLLSEIEAYGA